MPGIPPLVTPIPMAAAGAVEEAVAGEEVEAAVGVLAGDMSRMGMHPLPLRGGHQEPLPHGDRPPARNRRLSSSKTNKDSSSSKWRKSTNGSKNSLLRRKSKKVRGRGLTLPTPLPIVP